MTHIVAFLCIILISVCIFMDSLGVLCITKMELLSIGAIGMILGLILCEEWLE